MLRATGSLLFWAGITVSSILLFPVALLIWLVTLPFDPRRRVLHQFTCFWASLYTWLNPAWRVSVVGRENVRPGVAYVMVANHRGDASYNDALHQRDDGQIEHLDRVAKRL